MQIIHNYTGICPYCNVNVHFTPIKIDCWNCGKPPRWDTLDLGDEFAEASYVACDNCQKQVIIIFEGQKRKDNLVFEIKSTLPVVPMKNPPPGVLLEIWNDYVEANLCISVNAPKAAVVMLRRATQSLTKILGANPNEKLFLQIKSLLDNDIVTQHLYDLATELRLWGNFGAHPDDDLLSDVSIDEAEEMKEVFDLLLDYTLIQKEKVKRIKAKRKKKKR